MHRLHIRVLRHWKQERFGSVFPPSTLWKKYIGYSLFWRPETADNSEQNVNFGVNRLAIYGHILYNQSIHDLKGMVK